MIGFMGMDAGFQVLVNKQVPERQQSSLENPFDFSAEVPFLKNNTLIEN